MAPFRRLNWIILLAVATSSLAYGADTVTIASSDSTAAPKQPQLAIDASGTIHVVYGVENTIFYCRSTDGGESFTNPVGLPPAGVMALGRRRGPRIAIAGDNLCVAAICGQQGRGRDGDIVAFTSGDGGMNWTGPITINDVPGSAREGLHALAAGPNGQLCCAWLDLRHDQTEIFCTVSQDGGRTWADDALVYRSPDGSVCECCHPSVAYNSHGTLHIMFRNSLDGARDMYLARSTDGGKTFDQAVKLGKGTWPLDACPMDGGYLAFSAAGGMFTAWRRDNEVFLTAPKNNQEQRLGNGEQPWIATAKDRAYVVWLDEGRLMARSTVQEKPLILAENAQVPVVAAATDRAGLVVAAWEEDESIVCQVLGGQ